jgi:uncharacterized glyoxalase superfamily protein PhnB
LKKAYALISSTYCNKTMQNRVEEHPKFESIIRNDPIELLNELMYDQIRAKYPVALLIEAISRMLNLKQSENEGLSGYVKRFKKSHDIIKSYVGTDILDKFVENTLECQDESNATLKQEILIRNGNRAKYGSLSNGLVLQFSMQNNQYPKICTTATDILSNHGFDNRGDLNKKKWSNKTRKNADENTSSKTTNETTKTSFAQGSKDKICYCCRKKGHMSPECPDKNSIKKKDWHIKKAIQYYMEAAKADVHQNDQLDGDNESTTSKASSRIGWSGLLIEEKESMYNDDQDAKDRLKNCITLDNGSTLSLFSNPELVQNIQALNKTFSLATNAGVTQSNRKANVPGFGKVYYDEDNIANIFGFSDLKKKDPITYDSNKEDAFLVH